MKFSKEIEFIRSIYNTKNFIPLHEPRFVGNEKKYTLECIESTFVSSVGKFVDQFEIELAKYLGCKKVVVCVNGTNALQLCLKLVGVVPEDEVITQPLTFVATSNAIRYENAHPIFVDVEKSTLGMSPKSLSEFLERNSEMKNGYCYNKTTKRRIKACMPMHTFGHACQIDEILEICNAYNISLVEDAAEALGSKYNGKSLGTFGKVSALSFNGNKIMTTGGGGAIITDDEELAKKAKHLTTQCKIPHQWEYDHDEIGFNFRMPNINAALGLAQLENMSIFIQSKRSIANKYSAFFKNNDEISFVTEPIKSSSNYWLNAIIFKTKAQRDLFLSETNDNGVMTRPIWKLIPKLKMYNNVSLDHLTNALWLEDRIVNIPSSVMI